jgi:hypothetical protein
MCKHVFGKAAPAPLPPDDGWLRRDGAKGTLDAATHHAIRALCVPARAAAEAGRLDEANRAYEQALAKLPGNPSLWDAGSSINAAVGENHLRAGRYDLARKHLAAAVQGFNGRQTPMVRWLLGEAEVELGALDEAHLHLADARRQIGKEHLAARHPKYHAAADNKASLTQLADPPRPNEPAIHDSWKKRAMWVGPPARASLLYVIYGNWKGRPIIRSRYRVPPVLGIHVVERGHEVFQQWFAPPLDQLLRREADAAVAVLRAPHAVIVSGEPADAGTHIELRRTIGLVTAALPGGEAAVHDPAQLRWWSRERWLADFADGAGFDPAQHLRVSRRGEDVFSCGMRKFARPDVVVRRAAGREPEAYAILEAIMDSLVAGAPVASGPVKIGAKRLQMIAHLGDADRDNPFVENTWVEVV